MEVPQAAAMVTHSAVDEFYFSAVSSQNTEEIFPDDDRYAEELQLQEVLLSPFTSTKDPTLHLHFSRAEPPQPLSLLASFLERGECSRSTISTNSVDCEICADSKPPEEMFHSRSCDHLFCKDCVGRHIAAKVRESVSVVHCPDVNCEGVLELEHCRDLIPEEVFERWGLLLCESILLGWGRFYCPFKDCSAVFFLGGEEEEEVTQSECASCNRLFCAKCGVAWHAGFSCEEYQSLDAGEREREDRMLLELANVRRWKRCPRCRFFVERNEGCLHMTCRCKFQFCYGCGEEWSDIHSSCHT